MRNIHHYSQRADQCIMCGIVVQNLSQGCDIFSEVLKKEPPISNCSPARFAAMCVCYSKGNHV